MEKIIAEELLSIGAVFLRPEEPFTWASGIKSPVYDLLRQQTYSLCPFSPRED